MPSSRDVDRLFGTHRLTEQLGDPGRPCAVEPGVCGRRGWGGGGPQRPGQRAAADPIDGSPVGGQLGILQPTASPAPRLPA